MPSATMIYCVLTHNPHPGKLLATTAVGPYATEAEAQEVADEITAHFNPGYVNPNPDKPQWVNPPLEAIMEANGICASIQQLNMPMSEVYTFLESTVQFLGDAD